jgi:hypothetical protein
VRHDKSSSIFVVSFNIFNFLSVGQFSKTQTVEGFLLIPPSISNISEKLRFVNRQKEQTFSQLKKCRVARFFKSKAYLRKKRPVPCLRKQVFD